MDVLSFEIEIVKSYLVTAQAYLGQENPQLELGEIVLEGPEAREVLSLVIALKQKHLEQLLSLLSDGEGS